MTLHPSSAAVPFSLVPFRAREKKCGFITHAGQNRLLFLLLFITETAWGGNPGDMWSPKTQGYRQTHEPQYPDSATTSTGSCIDSFLSEKLLAVIYRSDYILYWAQSIVKFSCWFFKGGATFQCLQSHSTCTNTSLAYIKHIQHLCALMLPKLIVTIPINWIVDQDQTALIITYVVLNSAIYYINQI